jgi:hypothetical protein
MRRREFIGLIGWAAAGWPFTTRAQQRATPVVGFLSSRSPSESSGAVDSFRKGLRQIGFVEGQSVAIAFRWAEGRYDRLPALASELVDLPVAALFAAGGSSAHSRPKRRLRQFQLFSYRATPLAWDWLQASAIPVETLRASAICHPTFRANPQNC